MKKEYDFSKGKRGAVVPQKGKTRVTIWLDTAVVEKFRDKAEREGIGYQTAINAALKSHIEQDGRKIQDIVKDAVREGLKELKRAG